MKNGKAKRKLQWVDYPSVDQEDLKHWNVEHQNNVQDRDWAHLEAAGEDSLGREQLLVA